MKNTIKILGIDPGINNTGWNIGTYDKNTHHLNISQFGNLEANLMAKKESRDEFKVYGNIIPLAKLEREFTNIILTSKPDFIVSEDAFYNPKFPQAYLSLKFCIQMLKLASYKVNKVPYLIAPKSVKQQTWGHGTANKQAIQTAILDLPDLSIKDTKSHPVDKMIEHEADSIAVSYAFTKLILPSLLLQ